MRHTHMINLRLALRLWARHPVLSLAAIASLALGVGANTAIFSVLNGSVLRPLPYNDQERLMVVWETRAEEARRPVAPANFLDWRREAPAFAGSLAAFDDFSAALTGRGEAERLRTVSVSANFFDVLGVQAQTGRVMMPEDDRPDAPRVAVLTDGLWHRMFGGSRDAIGQTLILNGTPHTVVGVLPARFSFAMVSAADIWITGDRGIPRSFPFPGDVTAVRDSHIISVIGRLAPGASREQAQAQLTSVMTALASRFPSTNAGLGAHVRPLHEEIVGHVRPLMLLLQIAVAVLLLIACANVAHLLLGQAAGRQSEMAMRYAIGADRSRIVRQLLMETLVIAVPGGLAGAGLAEAGVRALVRVAPANLPRLDEVSVDGAALAFAAATTLFTAVAFGLWPAFQASHASAADLSQLGRRVAGSLRVRRSQQALVIAELALAQMLLIGAALLLVSFIHATQLDLGFAETDRVVAELNLSQDYVRTTGPSGAIDPSRKIRFINDVLESVRQAPGVKAAAASFTAPLTGAPNRGIRVEGDPELPPQNQPTADFQIITPDYFRALGITLVAGRGFGDADTAHAPAVTIVNQALVHQYFADRDPIGRVIVFGGSRRHQIIGVVTDARYRSVEQPADPTFYLPLEQNDERWPFLALTVWTDRSASAASAATTLLRTAVAQADRQQPISRIRSIEEILSDSLAPRRFNTWIVGLFAATALLLAAIGIYGVMAFAVTSRARELGVRSALGATPRELITMILRQGLWLTLAASAIGMAAAFALTRFMAAMLFNVTARDPWTYAAVAGLLAAVAMIATLVPAWRVMRVNPLSVLRAS